MAIPPVSALADVRGHAAPLVLADLAAARRYGADQVVLRVRDVQDLLLGEARVHEHAHPLRHVEHGLLHGLSISIATRRLEKRCRPARDGRHQQVYSPALIELDESRMRIGNLLGRHAIPGGALGVVQVVGQQPRLKVHGDEPNFLRGDEPGVFRSHAHTRFVAVHAYFEIISVAVKPSRN